MKLKSLVRGCAYAALVAALTAFQGGTAQAALLNINDSPLFLNSGAVPLNMLVMGRDHKLFMAAYNDASDLNGDGTLDVGYRGYLPKASGGIDYYGYFDSYKCYTYSGGRFNPSSTTADKTCNGSTWSGDFLNYVTMSRIDALRKVLYGGYRSTDDTSTTVLERAYIPQDAHSWGKEYQSSSRDGYDINKYTPLTAPSSGNYILFANTTPSNTLTSATNRNPTGAPLMRVLTNSNHRIWAWVSKEKPVAGVTTNNCAQPAPSTGEEPCGGTLVDYTVRVKVCDPSLPENNCKQYPNGTRKPTGLLHDYGEGSQMYFGLLTGSYMHNYQGGVVRKEVASFTDEVDANSGVFASPKKGIIASLDGLKIQDYNGPGDYQHDYSCSNPWNQAQSDGNCRIWGNPVGEMMFESLRYFAGASGPTTGYSYTNTGSDDANLGLAQVTAWRDPYKATASGGLGYASCSKPFNTVISDVNTSYDSELPGNPWTSVSFSLPSAISTLNVNSLGQTIWNNEFGAGSQNIFIGEVGATADGVPTVKSAASFGNIRGLSPEEPTKKGTYYSGSVSYFGYSNDINAASGAQKLSTFAVALSSPLPRMEIPVGGKIITLVPLGKVVNGPSDVSVSGGVSNGNWQPTEQIVAFYIDTMANMPGQDVDIATNGGRPYIKFRINFEDAEQGSDYDMDGIVLYTLAVTADNKLEVTLKTEYARAGYESHMGYVISGTDNRDGVYLEVSGGGSNNTHYKLDTPIWRTGTAPNYVYNYKWAGECASSPGSCQQLPGAGATTYPRTFTPGANAPALLLNDPLWYAAKYGGFTDKNNNGLPDAGEWDANTPGTPDNYFLVTNALTLKDQIAKSFDTIVARVASASSASVNAGSISSTTRVYQAKFNSGDWTGQLLSFPINTDGSLGTQEWDAAAKLPAPNSRTILTVGSAATASGTATLYKNALPFTWSSFVLPLPQVLPDLTRINQISASANPLSLLTDPLGLSTVAFIRGDAANEKQNGGTFRQRPTKLGDIISSAPVFVGEPAFFYPDNLETASYSAYKTLRKNREQIVYAGANDGMLHGFNAASGVEKLAYIPGGVFGNLKELTKQNYAHRFFVDGSPTMGDVFFNNGWHTVLVGGLNKGGQSIYALDVSDPSTFTEANAKNIVLWEFTEPDLGYTYSRPAIVRMPDNGATKGKWVAIFGNGYNNTEADGNASTTGNAALYVVDIETGALLKKIDTKVGMTQDPLGLSRANGLATPAVVDINGDNKVDYAYAGDLFGNLWKFKFPSGDSSTWDVAYYTTGTPSVPQPLFKAKDSAGTAQPITSRPEVGRGPKGAGMVVLFGTGKFLEGVDKSPTQTQSFYGILDPNRGATDVITSNRSTALQQQQITVEQLVDFSGTLTPIRVTTNNTVATTKSGWYMDLLSGSPGIPPPSGFKGEMQVSDSVLRNGRIIFTTLIPSADPCAFGGDSWLMELDALTGSRLLVTPFDLNRDEEFDDDDLATVTDPVTGQPIKVPVTGRKSDVGITPKPGILAGEKAEYKYTPGTSGSIQVTVENPGPNAQGRQSWRQIR